MQHYIYTFVLNVIIIIIIIIIIVTQNKYVGNSISKLQIQVATYVFELSAGNCYR